MFYTYKQNNSGGSFDFDAKNGISVVVIVEAENAEQADAKALDIGLYFDGCETGADCDCCGDRWYSNKWGADASDEPAVYGTPVREWILGKFFSKWRAEGEPEGFTHYADGTVQGFAMHDPKNYEKSACMCDPKASPHMDCPVHNPWVKVD